MFFFEKLRKNCKICDENLLNFSDRSGAKECKSCRAQKMPQNAPFLAIRAVDTDENEPPLFSNFVAVFFRFSAFCSIFSALQDLHPSAPRRSEKFSKFSSQILQFFAIFRGKTSNFDNFRCKFRWNSTNFCQNLTDYTENAAKCWKSKENHKNRENRENKMKKVRFELDKS